MKRFFLAGLLGALLGSAWLAAPPRISAASLSMDGATGQAYRGFGAKMKIDLPAPSLSLEPAEEDEEDWTGEADYSYLEAYNATPTRIGELAAGIERLVNDAWSVRVTGRGARDEISTLQYFSPAIGFSYRWLPEMEGQADLLDVAVGVEAPFYRTDTNIPGRRAVLKGRTVALAAGNGRRKNSEFHPYFSIAKPLAGGAVTPRLSGGHHSFSFDPNGLERFIGRPRLAASADSINSLVGGFLRDDGKASLNVKLSPHASIDGSLGAARSATDGNWAVIQEGAFLLAPDDHIQFHAGWRRALQYGISQDAVSGGVTLSF